MTEITDQIGVLLIQGENQARRVRQIYTAHPEALEETYQLMLALKDFPEDAKHRWRTLIERRGGIVNAAIKSAASVEQSADNERSEIRRKIAKISGGAASAGDFGDSFECGLMIGLAIGCAMAGMWPLAVAAALAALEVC